MIRAWLLLLSLLLAMPAAGAARCHEAAATPAVHAHAGMTDHDAPAPAAERHECIGCIPPGDWLVARVTPPLARPDAALAATLAVQPAAVPARPIPPPPKRG